MKKASGRTWGIAIAWIIATAIMAYLTDVNDWNITYLAIVSVVLLIAVGISYIFD